MSKRSTEKSVVRTKHYRQRLKKFARAMKPNSVAVIVSNPERVRSNDTHHAYRQSSDILYLNGFGEPDSVLVISNGENRNGDLTMFVAPRDAVREQWTGIRTGVEGTKKYLAKEAYPVAEFASKLPELLNAADHVYYKFGRNEHFDQLFHAARGETAEAPLNPEEILHKLRMIKGPEEIALMDEAARISAKAHCEAALRCRVGMKEYQLQSILEHEFMMGGAMAPAYGSIVATGANGWVLHYVSNQDTMEDGDLVLIDAACEYKGYAADITRTFPVNGKFSSAQREIYELVLDAQVKAVAAAKPGVSQADVHKVACDAMRDGLQKLGILKPASTARSAGSPQKSPTLATYYPHGTGHWLGLDVHDVSFDESTGARTRDTAMEPGMVITVEPGLYFAKDDENVPKRYRGIAIRIEDDVLITTDGNRVLTVGVPKTVSEIEELMAKGCSHS